MGVDYDASYGIGVVVDGEEIIEIVTAYDKDYDSELYGLGEAMDILGEHTPFYFEEIGSGCYSGNINEVLVSVDTGDLNEGVGVLAENIETLKVWCKEHDINESIGLNGGIHVW